MKRFTLSLAALCASFFVAGLALGQNNGAPAQKQQKLVKVATITGAAAVREFQNNVQLLQTQRQAIGELRAAIEKEKNPKQKKELQQRLDSFVKKLEENNALMVKNYGFSLTRNYTLEIETANIYTLVTDEEAAQLEKAAAARAKPSAK